jgi:hypothetical protein
LTLIIYILNILLFLFFQKVKSDFPVICISLITKYGKKHTPNAGIAANLYRASAAVTIINYFLIRNDKVIPRTESASILFFTVLIIIGIAYLINKGYSWIRWVLLVLFAIDLPFIVIGIPSLFTPNILSGCCLLLINLLQLLAAILLFVPYKIPVSEAGEPIAMPDSYKES